MDWPTLVRPCEEVHRRTSFMKSFLLFQLWPVWFVRWEIGGHTPAVSWGVVSRICSKQTVAFLSSFHPAFFLDAFR